MRKITVVAILMIVIAGFAFQSCSKDNSLEKLRQSELELLGEFVAKYNTEHGVELEPSVSGLYYVEVEAGVGDTIVPGDKIQVWYNTYLLVDTSLVDSNMEAGHKFNPLEFIVTDPGNSSVVEGLNEAVKNMRAEGKSFLIVPSQIAYGQDGRSGIPSFATLLFDIEIYKVFRAVDAN
ncbi:MAG: FKBP-type peptidyl-prolyl cis-trans isomerase [Mariniphaga sp.]|nr:FKBP-type peptidyl-prolyl cis-trans isomerase [Mariniphaga sp.]